MKKPLILALLLLAAGILGAQTISTRTGHIWFFSSTPLENIEAHNNQAAANLNTQTGDMAFIVLMNGFQFEKAEMQKHFQEKYAESEKYPKSTFSGKISNIGSVNFRKNGTYPVQVSGTMDLHGVKKPVSANGSIIVLDGKIRATSKFQLATADYNISIPAAVRDNIAKTLDVNVDVTYSPLNP